jgi:hypothetical protein
MAPMAHGLPTSVAAASRVLFGPLRNERPIGWTGGRYSTSNPSPATYGRRSMTSASVPWRAVPSTVERGNSSYHALKRARSGSTCTG